MADRNRKLEFVKFGFTRDEQHLQWEMLGGRDDEIHYIIYNTQTQDIITSINIEPTTMCDKQLTMLELVKAEPCLEMDVLDKVVSVESKAEFNQFVESNCSFRAFCCVLPNTARQVNTEILANENAYGKSCDQSVSNENDPSASHDHEKIVREDIRTMFGIDACKVVYVSKCIYETGTFICSYQYLYLVCVDSFESDVITRYSLKKEATHEYLMNILIDSALFFVIKKSDIMEFVENRSGKLICPKLATCLISLPLKI